MTPEQERAAALTAALDAEDATEAAFRGITVSGPEYAALERAERRAWRAYSKLAREARA